MKNSILTTTTCSMAAMGLAVLPVLAIDAQPASAGDPASVVAANTTTVYIVKVSGKG
jgi:hypothetical protein